MVHKKIKICRSSVAGYVCVGSDLLLFAATSAGELVVKAPKDEKPIVHGLDDMQVDRSFESFKFKTNTIAARRSKPAGR